MERKLQQFKRKVFSKHQKCLKIPPKDEQVNFERTFRRLFVSALAQGSSIHLSARSHLHTSPGPMRRQKICTHYPKDFCIKPPFICAFLRLKIPVETASRQAYVRVSPSVSLCVSVFASVELFSLVQFAFN